MASGQVAHSISPLSRHSYTWDTWRKFIIWYKYYLIQRERDRERERERDLELTFPESYVPIRTLLSENPQDKNFWNVLGIRTLFCSTAMVTRSVAIICPTALLTSTKWNLSSKIFVLILHLQCHLIMICKKFIIFFFNRRCAHVRSFNRERYETQHYFHFWSL